MGVSEASLGWAVLIRTRKRRECSRLNRKRAKEKFCIRSPEPEEAADAINL